MSSGSITAPYECPHGFGRECRNPLCRTMYGSDGHTSPASPFASRLHAAIALAHWYIGQAGLKLRNGHHDEAQTALSNADKFVSVVGKEIAPDLERLPESLRQALIAHGEDPDRVSLKSAESWSPPSEFDPAKLADEGLDELIDETLRRMGAEPLERGDD